MSLGVKSIRRAPAGVRRLSLIPRVPFPAALSGSLCLSPHLRRLSSQTLDDGREVGTVSRDASPSSSSKSVVSPITLVDRLSHLPVRQHGARESVLVEPRIEYPHPRETLRSERRNHQGVTAQLRLDRIREIQHEPPPNWRAVLHALTVWTPTYSADAVEVVLPPEDAAGLLRADAEENIWDIQSRTGVSMKLEPGARENTAQSLLLSGDRRAIESAVEDIVRVTKKTTRVFLSGEGSRPATSNNEVPSPSGGQDTDTAAAAAAAAPPVPIWEAIPQAPRKLYALKTRADEIPRPKTWAHA